jgi:hypothetical protein
MARLLLNQPVSQPQREFMDRFESLLEYFKPKLARRELTGEDGGALTIKMVNFSETTLDLKGDNKQNDKT